MVPGGGDRDIAAARCWEMAVAVSGRRRNGRPVMKSGRTRYEAAPQSRHVRGNDEPGGSAAPSGFACRFKEKPRSPRGSFTYSLLARRLISVATQGIDVGYAHIAALGSVIRSLPGLRMAGGAQGCVWESVRLQ